MNIGRIKTAIDFLEDGRSFSIDDLMLNIENNTIIITGWSQYHNFNNLTKEIALTELNEIKKLFNHLLKVSTEFSDLIIDKSLEFNLNYDDSGKCSVAICSEREGVINWKVNLR